MGRRRRARRGRIGPCGAAVERLTGVRARLYVTAMDGKQGNGTQGRRRRRGRGPPVLTLGLRPFYLLAAAFAAVALPVWHFSPPDLLPWEPYLAGPAWHAHEMVFGFAAAAMTGFLLTAARAWTGRATPAGWRLAALAGLWAAGRVMVVTGPALPAIAVDGLFLPCVALAVGLPVVRARNHRNLAVAALPALLGAANLLFHLDHAGWIALARANGGALLALDLFALLVALMAGRVIPAFTANAVPTARPRRNACVEAAAFGTLVVIALAGPLDPWLPDGPWLAAVAATGALAHIVRLSLWAPAATLREPLLWILPLSYAWLPASLILRALWLADVGVPAAQTFHTLALHALGAGAMGGLMLGMMTRSALGHTGRPLAAGGVERAAYILVHAGAALRVFGPLAGAEAEPHALAASALLWPGAFALFLAAYWPVLTRPRVDEAQAPGG